MEVQRYNFLFKGIKCSVWIKALYGEKYQILLRSEKKLNTIEQKTLLQYLEDEGYMHEGEIILE